MVAVFWGIGMGDDMDLIYVYLLLFNSLDLQILGPEFLLEVVRQKDCSSACVEPKQNGPFAL